MKITCKYCGHQWEYKGSYMLNQKAMVTCPACIKKVRLYPVRYEYE